MEEINSLVTLLVQDESETSDSDSENDTDSSDSGESDFELFPLLNPISKRQDMPRIKGYIEVVIPLMLEKDFKSHFRLTRTNVEVVGNMVNFLNDILSL